jgi:phosphoribosylformylglycinamidine synthase subunit PurQ / glutaminase
MASARPEAAVVVFPGSNGDRDLYETFERAGFAPRYVWSNEALPQGLTVVGLPGGFSYGDYWRAGVLASRARAMQDLPGHVERGGLVIGICNGFQILVESGLLPGGLRFNDPPGFRHRWLTVQVRGATASPWTHGIAPGTRLRLPMAHGEGNYFHPDGPEAIRPLVPMVYEKNPNGSIGDAAAILDRTGRVIGVMPHPERAADPDLGSADGLTLFRAAAAWLGEARS